MVLEFGLRFLAFGMLGLLIENIFTGIRSLLVKNWFGTCTTYLWMLPVYGIAGLALDGVHSLLQFHWLLMAPIYVAIIYGTEFTSAWILKKLIGAVPWDYGLSKWTPFGFVNFTYPYALSWFALACAFNPISLAMSHALNGLLTLLSSV